MEKNHGCGGGKLVETYHVNCSSYPKHKEGHETKDKLGFRPMAATVLQNSRADIQAH